MTESRFQTICIKLIESKGGYVINIHGSPLTPKGTHDLAICINGRYLSCEVKRPDGKGVISTQQIIQGKKVLKAKGGVIFCETLEHLEKALDYYLSLPQETFPESLIFGGISD